MDGKRNTESERGGKEEGKRLGKNDGMEENDEKTNENDWKRMEQKLEWNERSAVEKGLHRKDEEL